MNYMPIVPIGMFDVLDMSRVKDVFILSQFWNDQTYREYYKSRRWDTVIIDNDLYESEEAADLKDMVKIANSLNANRIFLVGPEELSNGLETARMTQDIMDHWHSYSCNNTRLMCILHESPNEMKLQYKILKDFQNLAFGISIFSFRLGYDRASLMKFCEVDPSRYVHAFGWDNLLEVLNMRGCGFDSVDSSIAITAAYHNISLRDDWQITRQPGRAGVHNSSRVDILTDYFEEDVKMQALDNIIFLREWCNPPIPVTPAYNMVVVNNSRLN